MLTRPTGQTSRVECQADGRAAVLMGVRTVRAFYIGIAAALLLAALTPGIAAAVVPPGHAVGNQYVETVPGAGGEEATAAPIHDQTPGGGSNGNSGGSSGGGAASPTEALGAKTTKRFEKAGDAGRAAANLAAATDPSTATAKDGGSNAASVDGGESPLKQVVGHLTGTSDDSGMGLLLPTLILASAVVAVGFLFAKRRPSQPRI
jgi:hypothetical protein